MVLGLACVLYIIGVLFLVVGLGGEHCLAVGGFRLLVRLWVLMHVVVDRKVVEQLIDENFSRLVLGLLVHRRAVHIGNEKNNLRNEGNFLVRTMKAKTKKPESIYDKIGDFSNLSVAILLNGPLLPKQRDVPCVESLREISNIIKCRSIYHQYTYVDWPMVAGTPRRRRLGETFPIDRLKWDPSRVLCNKILDAQFSIYRKASFKKNSKALLAESLVNLCFKRPYASRDKLEIRGKLDEVLGRFDQSRNQQELYFSNRGTLVMRHLSPNRADVQTRDITQNNNFK